MGYAFISYSSKNQQMADSFKAFFNQNGIETWMAPGDIPFGSTYTSAINRAIKESGCFVLLLSGNAQESPWVLKETERAISTGKTIFTVLLDDVSMNDDFEFMLSTSQAVAIRKIDESDDKVRRLIKAIKMYTGEERQETVINSSLRHELDNKSISPAEPSSKPKNNICQSDLTPLGLQYTTGGDPGGLCEQALKYYNGTGGYKKDERKAVKLFRESANYYNYVPAYNYLGRIFMERRNFANASKWYRSSAVANTAEGLCMMGYFYQTGLGGVKRSTSSALECYENAAATGEFEQIIDIAKKFLEGRVVPREDGVAADILAAAVKAGSEDARFYMAKSDQSGFGVNADSLPVQPQPYNEELKIGDKVEFGLYPFDDKRTWKKIGWEILDIKNDKALLWADFCVDAYPYHYIRKSCDWSSCSLRDWLRNLRQFLSMRVNCREQIANPAEPVNGQDERRKCAAVDSPARLCCSVIKRATAQNADALCHYLERGIFHDRTRKVSRAYPAYTRCFLQDRHSACCHRRSPKHTQPPQAGNLA